MDNKNLDLALSRLAELKNEISLIDYAQTEYDRLEDEIHAFEDQVMEEYGDFLEQAITEVHTSCCSDSEVLIPIAYLAGTYISTDEGYEVAWGQGVSVDARDYPNSPCWLVLVPGPTRLMLLVGEEHKKIVWHLGD